MTRVWHLRMLSHISTALEKKDRYTQAHSHRVALYAMRLARRLVFPMEEIRNVGMGGFFHDVGKLAMSDRIFSNQESGLSDDLMQEVRRHPLIGAALLKNIDFLEPVVDFVLYHHEREDGNGYPYGLKAGEIPVGAKIIGIADSFDAITTDRPYQKGQTVEAAFEILREDCRHYFCEEYVEAFVEEIDENGIVKENLFDPLFADLLVRSAAGYAAN